MATASVGDLYVSLRANHARFAADMKAAERPLTAFRTNVLGMSRSLAGMFGVGLGVGGMAAGIGTMVHELDDLAKTSRKIGLTAEQLTALRFAAKHSGLEVSTLDMGMQRMTRRMAEASVGTGEALKAIEEMGLDPKALAGEGTYAMLAAIAEAMKDVENPATRLRLAFKLFDSEGVGMVNMLDKGAEGLREFKRQADALTGITPGLMASAEQTADAWANVGTWFKGTMQNAANNYRLFGAALQEGIPGHAIGTREMLQYRRKEADALERSRNEMAEMVKLTKREAEWEPHAKGLVTMQQSLERQLAMAQGATEMEIYGKATIKAALAVGRLNDELLDDLALKHEIADETKRLNDEKKLGIEREALVKSLRTPLEIFKDEKAEAQKLLGDDKSMYSRAEQKFRRDYLEDAARVLKADELPQAAPASAAVLGTSSAVNRIASQQVASLQFDEQKKSNALLDKIKAAVEAMARKTKEETEAAVAEIL